MNARAIRWAESVLDEPVTASHPLPGGMTSTMLALSTASGRQSVLRLMTNQPWRAHGADLVRRERAAQLELAATGVPAPRSLGTDPDGTSCGVAAHLMSRLPGRSDMEPSGARLQTMADLLARIHGVRPTEPFREYQSWAWEAKWVVPRWTRDPAAWEAAFAVLAEPAPPYDPTFLHRDYSHRNLLWDDGAVTGVVDWVETSTGPAWLDAGHAATNLAVAFDTSAAWTFLDHFAAATRTEPAPYWLVMDAVGFLPPPGKEPMFGTAEELARLDGWLCELVR